jgi:hypothetical protein
MSDVVEQLSPMIDTEQLFMGMERRVEKGECLYQRYSKGMVHQGDGKVHITEAMDLLHCMKRMEAVPKRIANGEEVAVKLDRRMSGRGAFPALTPLGKAMNELYKEAVPLMEMLYPDCCRNPSGSVVDAELQRKKVAPSDVAGTQFNAHITVMLRACQGLRHELHRRGYSTLEVDQPFARKAIERSVRFVRRVCRSKPFKAIDTKQRRNEQKNFESDCQYMAATFAEYSKLLVMRVDLYFPFGHDSWADKFKAEIRIKRFLRAVREDRIVPDVKAWICKRENAPLRGIHFHLMVALDGHKHCAASAYSQVLCKAWEGHYTDGQGTSFNCYVRRNEHEFNGLGLVHVSDREKLMGIRAMIKYMVKGPSWIRTGSQRNLWRGTIKLMRGEGKRGAPRKAGHDMSLVNEILGHAKLPSG